jgi:hypothetical protein
MIDDDKYKRIKDIIKIHGPLLNEKQISDNSSDCSANSCPLAKVNNVYFYFKREDLF